jgi:hypothetical protein
MKSKKCPSKLENFRHFFWTILERCIRLCAFTVISNLDLQFRTKKWALYMRHVRMFSRNVLVASYNPCDVVKKTIILSDSVS